MNLYSEFIMCRVLFCVAIFYIPVVMGAEFQELLAKYCYECHGEKEVEAEIDFKTIKDFKSYYENYDVLKYSLMNVEAREMPPKKSDISIKDRKKLISHLKKIIREIETFANDDPGPSPVRRLSSVEYDNSIEAVTGLRLNLSEMFPANGTAGEGFSNDHSAMNVTALQFEKFFEAAQQISSHSLFDLDKGFVFKRETVNIPSEPDKIFFKENNSSSNNSDKILKLKKHIEKFIFKVFRFPQEQSEIDRMTMDFLEDTQRFGVQMASRLFIIRCFASTKFIFRIEEKAEEKRRVTGYELASRLSYFIWSSPPDKELYALAETGELLRKEVIIYEVERMLKDDRSRALADNFAAEWLKFGEIKDRVTADQEKFPFFTIDVANDLYEESARYFDYILKEDMSVLDVIDSDYTFANNRLAEIYKIPKYGFGFKKVRVTDRTRGGMLTHGSILTITSLPKRTSPIHRGNWIISSILGTPTPPPPPNAGMLPEETNTVKGDSLEALLAEHRNSPACKGCHQKIDPAGFPLENYDAVGRWRETYENNQPVENIGTIADKSITGPGELKDYLMDKKHLFIRNISQKMFGYALGRKINVGDLYSIKQMEMNLQRHDYRIFALVATIALSNQFQYKRKSQ